MFNRTIIAAAPRVPDHVTVHEHRAPTDESVRLLAEMQEAVEKRILAAVRVTDTPVEIVIHLSEDFMNDKRTYVAVFKVCGSKMTATYGAQPDDDKDKVALGIRNAVAKEIANVLVSVAMPKLLGKMGGQRI